MSPITHLLASWMVAAKTTDNPRDCRLVTLAGILPDADGLGVVVDLVAGAFGWRQRMLYGSYHHVLLHGLFGGILITGLLAFWAQRRGRFIVAALVVFHLHLLFDLVGSRGPAPEDLWPIFYLGPFWKEPMWIWSGQWALDAWPNRVIALGLFVWAMGLAVRRGDSFVGAFNRRADAVFVGVLRKWWAAAARFSR